MTAMYVGPRSLRQDAALTRHQRIAVIAQTCNVGGERRHCPGLATSSPDHGGELVDTLQRLALPAGQLGEDLALVLAELFPHRRNQQCAPRPPTVTRDRGAKQVGIRERLAQRNAWDHSDPSASMLGPSP